MPNEDHLLSNNPPSDLELYANKLKNENEDIAKIIDDLVVGFSRLPKEVNDSNAPRIVDFIKQAKETSKAAEVRRQAERKIWSEYGEVVQGYFKGLSARLDELTSNATKVFAEYQQAKEAEATRKAENERQRLVAEERKADDKAAEARRIAENEAQQAEDAPARRRAVNLERVAREAEAKAKEAQKATKAVGDGKTTIEGDYGAKGFTKKRWVHKIVDISKVPKKYLMVNEKALRDAYMKRAKIMKIDSSMEMIEVDGIKIYQKVETQIK